MLHRNKRHTCVCDFEWILLRMKWWILISFCVKRFYVCIGHLFSGCQNKEQLDINLTLIKFDYFKLQTIGQRTVHLWFFTPLQLGLNHHQFLQSTPLSPTVIYTECRSKASLVLYFNCISFRSLKTFYTLLTRSLIGVVEVASSPEGWFWAPETRERHPGSFTGPSPHPGAYTADLRGDESRGLPPPRRLPLPVTHRSWGKPHRSKMWLIFAAVCSEFIACCNS